MSITEDLKNVSEAALGKLAAQFGDLPRPLLAAIGVGDVAVERLVRLRDQLGDLWHDERDETAGAGADEAGAAGNGDEDGPSRLADATRRAQRAAEDVARRLGDVMGEVPDRTQRMIADLPAKAQEVANSLSRENLRETVENYTKRVTEVYRELAARGGDRVHEAADKNAAHQADGAPAGAADKPAPAAPTSTARAKAGRKAATDPAGRKAASTRPSAGEPARPRRAAPKPATPGPATPGPATTKPTTTKPAGRKPAAGDDATD